MSYRCLLLAVRDTLRSQLSFKDRECDLAAGGRPHPGAGERFIAVHRGAKTNRSKTCLDEYYGVNVTVSMKFSAKPQDRFGAALLEQEETGLDDICQKIIATIQADCLNYYIVNLANQYLVANVNGTMPNGFMESLSFSGDQEPQLQGPDWWRAEPGKEPWLGFVQRLQFGGARRIQALQYYSPTSAP